MPIDDVFGSRLRLRTPDALPDWQVWNQFKEFSHTRRWPSARGPVTMPGESSFTYP